MMWPFGKTPTLKKLPDQVWSDIGKKYSALIALATATAELPLLIVAHFDTTHDMIRVRLQESGVAAKELRSSLDAFRLVQGEFGGGVVTMLAGARTLTPLHVPQDSRSSHLRIVVAERHPSWMVEAALQKWFSPFTGNLMYLESLDSPIFSVFGVERIRVLLKSMGLSESEAIEHRMITNAIEKAQKKIAEKAMGHGPARSAEEWLKNYFPQNHPKYQ